MLMTTNKADEMTCPLMSDGQKAIECVSNACPAWRWWDPFDSNHIVVLSDPPAEVEEKGDEAILEWIKTTAPTTPKGGWLFSYEDWAWTLCSEKTGRRGYCGLAGKPDHE